MDTSRKGTGLLFNETHNVFLVHECHKIIDFKFMVILDFFKEGFYDSLWVL